MFLGRFPVTHAAVFLGPFDTGCDKKKGEKFQNTDYRFQVQAVFDLSFFASLIF